MYKRQECSIARKEVAIGDEPRFIVLARDITRRRNAENSLRESRNLLQIVVDHIPGRVFWKDRSSRYLGCNRKFAKDAGRNKADELAGTTDYELAWRDQAGLYRADDKTVMESGVPKLDYDCLLYTSRCV